jgi:hypothetical protein
MFRLFGFDVHVRAGFVVFLVLIAMINPSAFGLWVAVGIAVFTLLHELGHAVAARRPVPTPRSRSTSSRDTRRSDLGALTRHPSAP